MRKIITIDLERCMGCRSCQLACAVAHSQTKRLETAINEKPKPKTRILLENVNGFAVPLQCRHCENAPCIKVCPTMAIEREEDNGPVLIDQRRCIGCKWCVMACPFGVIHLDYELHAIIKCDLCRERLAEGEYPACVASCPTHALRFMEEKDIPAKKRERMSLEMRL